MHKLLKEMTLIEKVGQINQHLYGWEVYEKDSNGIHLTQKFKDEVARYDGIGAIYGLYRSDPWSGKNLETGVNQEEGKLLVKMVQEYIKKNTRLKIPVLISEETPHGLQGLASVTLPSNIAVGQTWNPRAVFNAQKFVSRQVSNRDINLALITCLDVMRDPRWGRSEECFSEDPVLSKILSKASVAGLQSDNVIAVAKHFCGQGDGYGGLNAAPASIGERELREIHLPPFEGALESGCRSIMAAYNEIDGVLCHDNKWLLQDLARKELGFNGFVMADGVALDRLAVLSGSRKKAAARGLKAGVDLSLWDDVYTIADQAVNAGFLDESILDQSVLRILEAKESLGLFSKHEPNQVLPEYDIGFVDQLTEEAFVLIKNNNGLAPISINKKIAVVGPNANNIYNQCGDYTPYKDLTSGSTFLDAIGAKYETLFAQGTQINEDIENGIKEAMEVSKKSDFIVVCIGGASTRDFNTLFDANGAAISGSNNMTSGENIDLSDISIPSVQVELVKALATLNKPMVGLVVQGRVHAIDEVEDFFDTIFVAGFPGERGGQAFAKILSGEISPSGKMAMSIPASKVHLPSFYNYKKSEQNEHYVDTKQVSRYPFGTGLSYTNFKIDNPVLKYNKDVTITGTITNTGNIEGSEVIQVYIRHEESSVIQRVKSLKAFDKISLKPNEKKTFSLSLSEDDLKVWTKSKQYEIEEGKTLVIIETTDFKEEFIIDKVGVPTY